MGFMDCDSHVLEVPETWDFLDPKEEHFRPQIARFEDGAAIRLGARAQNEGLPRTPFAAVLRGGLVDPVRARRTGRCRRT